MAKTIKSEIVPHYRGRRWIAPALPDRSEPWPLGEGHSSGKDRANHAAFGRELKKALSHGKWRWPKRPVCFLSDLHADSDAFWASLVASGGIKKTGPGDKDFKLTRFGRQARFMIGGDCFDKGPSTLDLLDNIRRLEKKGARLDILAGNHDMRMMLGISRVGAERDPHTEHFFVRMGPKVVPFLQEIHDRYLARRRPPKGLPGKAECRRLLYPREQWFDEFPLLAGWVMPDQTIEREMKRMRAKMDRFEDDCESAGLSLPMVYAAAREWQRRFLHPKGDYAWFFRRMTLARRIGTFLFIHAGLDDRSARIIHDQGIKQLNRMFRYQVARDPFGFYYGPVANTIRTKYRDVDQPLTRYGVKLVRRAGIQAVVHGHHNRLAGQRIMLQQGMIHFECDASLDRGTRRKEGLRGHGAAATLFLPGKQVLGVSSDYPRVKVFDPKTLKG